jgi:hypothetical protein
MKKRKVLFKKWIPKVIEKKPGNTFDSVKEGTGKMEDDFTHEGIFHKWGSEVEDTGEQIASFTVAIVELPDGTVQTILPQNIKFVK